MPPPKTLSHYLKRRKIMSNNFFKKADVQHRRLKLFVWGDAGCGKTTLALQFPAPAVIDTESGTHLYAKDFSFDRLDTDNWDGAVAAVDWLAANKHTYKTLVIDSITDLYESLLEKWDRKFGGREWQPRDWAKPKKEFKHFLRRLSTMDMNIVMTAQTKTKYSKTEFMKAEGMTFDSDRKTEYKSDVNIEVFMKPDGHYGRVEKIRGVSGIKRGDEFKLSMDWFKKTFGADIFEQAAEPIKFINPDQEGRIVEIIEDANIRYTEEDVNKVSNKEFGDNWTALTETDAAMLLVRLEKAIFNDKNKKKAKEEKK